ncbi:MAG: UvrB/UvrC motif-containing protein [Sarcina sp.]
MICELCGVRQATVKLVKITDGVKKERLFCSTCAVKMSGIDDELISDGIKNFDFNKLIDSFLNYVNLDNTNEDEISEKKCGNCGMTYEQINKEEIIGCNKCYEIFTREIEMMINKVQGISYHKKKNIYKFISEKSDSKKELEYQLEEAIKLEDYEKAAFLRDYLKIFDDKKE